MMDPILKKELEAEADKQISTINLIASENYATNTVLYPLSTCLSNKYADGDPGARDYPGVDNFDKIELLAIKHLRTLFKLNEQWIINVQPLSGAPANLELFTILFPLKSKLLMLSHNHGGHMSHGDAGSLMNKIFDVSEYYLDSNGFLNYDTIEKRIVEVQPTALIAGFSLYPRDINYERLKEICKSHGVHLHIDMAHTAGLIAAGVMNSPFNFADSVTTTTHKTLRGPRAGLIFSKVNVMKGVYPGVQTGPHMATIAAIAQCAYEADTNGFKQYATTTIELARCAAAFFEAKGYKIQTGGTDSHMILVNFPEGCVEMLGNNGIFVNNCHLVNGDHGARLGWACMASLGIKVDDVKTICEIILKALNGENVLSQVKQITAKYIL